MATDLKNVFDYYGDWILMVLAGISVIVFAMFMITGGSAPVDNPADFPNKIRAAISQLDEEGIGELEVKEYVERVRKPLSGVDADYSSEGLSQSFARTDLHVDLFIQPPGEEWHPARDLRVEKASRGEVILSWIESDHEDKAKYQVDWYKIDRSVDAEDPDPNDPYPPAIEETRGSLTVDCETFEPNDQGVGYPRAQAVISGLDDNQEYFFEVRTMDRRDRPVRYRVGEENLRERVQVVGEERWIPHPESLRIAEQSLAGVTLQWDPPDALQDPDKQYPDGSSYRTLLYRWSEGEEPQIIAATLPTDEQPLGWEGRTGAYTDTSVEPERAWYYGIRFYHIEAFPPGERALRRSNGTAKAETLEGEPITTVTYRGQPFNVPFPEIDRSGQPSTDRDGNIEWLEGGRQVFASPMVTFEGCPVMLENKPVLFLSRVIGAEPIDPGRGSATIEILAYHRVAHYDTGEPTWVQFRGEFRIGFGDGQTTTVGGMAEPSKVLTAQGMQDLRATPWRSVGELDFRTPYELAGIFETDSPSGETCYVELQNTRMRNTWPFRLYQQGTAVPSGISEHGGNRNHGYTQEQRRELFERMLTDFRLDLTDEATAANIAENRDFKRWCWEREIRAYSSDDLEGAIRRENYDQWGVNVTSDINRIRWQAGTPLWQEFHGEDWSEILSTFQEEEEDGD